VLSGFRQHKFARNGEQTELNEVMWKGKGLSFRRANYKLIKARLEGKGFRTEAVFE